MGALALQPRPAKTASRSNPAPSRTASARRPVSYRGDWEKSPRYDQTASSGSVTHNSPLQFTDPNGEAAACATDEVCVTAHRLPRLPLQALAGLITLGTGVEGLHFNASANSPSDHQDNRDHDKEEEEANKDEAVCRSLGSAAARAKCWASANERRGARAAGRPLPPLITERTSSNSAGGSKLNGPPTLPKIDPGAAAVAGIVGIGIIVLTALATAED
jgi:hypothetical protein